MACGLNLWYSLIQEETEEAASSPKKPKPSSNKGKGRKKKSFKQMTHQEYENYHQAAGF